VSQVASLSGSVSAPILNNREIATLLWLGVGTGALLVWGVGRRSLRDLLKIFVSSGVRVLLLGILAYVALLVWGLDALGIWDRSLLFETLAWLFGGAFGLLFRLDNAKNGDHVFWGSVRSSVALTVFIGFFTNMFPFSLWVEIVLVFMITLIVLMTLVAGMKPDLAPVKRFFDSVTVLAVLALMAYTIRHLWYDPGALTSEARLRGLTVPMLLMVAFTPLAYGLALASAYRVLLVRVRFRFDRTTPLYRRLRRWAFWTARLRLSSVEAVDTYLVENLYPGMSDSDIVRTLSSYERD
jgi:hypothetical protein